MSLLRRICFFLMLLILLPAMVGVSQAKGGRLAHYAPFGIVPKPSQQWRIGVLEECYYQFWLELKRGYEDAARKYGVKVEIFAPPTADDILLQAQMLGDMLAKNYDVLSVSPLTVDNLTTTLGKASDMGYPILIVVGQTILPEARKLHNVKIMSYIATDFIENGRLPAQYIADKLGPEGGEVAHISGFPGGDSSERRKSGYLEVIQQNPQLKSVAVVSGDWDRKKSMDVAADLLQSHPNLKAIHCANDDEALGALQAVKNAGKLGKVMVTGCDAIPDALESIMKGELNATVAFMQYEMGWIAVEASILLMEGHGDKIPEEIMVHQELWTKDNIADKADRYRDYYDGLKKLPAKKK